MVGDDHFGPHDAGAVDTMVVQIAVDHRQRVQRLSAQVQRQVAGRGDALQESAATRKPIDRDLGHGRHLFKGSTCYILHMRLPYTGGIEAIGQAAQRPGQIIGSPRQKLARPFLG